MRGTVEIEEALHDSLKETDLLAFQSQLARNQLTRLDHFDHVTDVDLKKFGISDPAIRRLRTAIEKRKKAIRKGKLRKGRMITIQLEGTGRSASVHDSLPSSSSASTPILIEKDHVKLMERLGEGTFAVVKRAIWTRSDGQRVECAVKIMHEMSEMAREDLQKEIATMQSLRHPNLVQLYGIVLGDTTQMVIEFCDGGALLDRLRDTQKPALLVTKLLEYAKQIASGMAYLELDSKRCVHRDLAARNVLLTNNEETAKICDFGLTRSLNQNEHLYTMSAQKKVPFAWCPPESLRRREFSHKSDVWAFGVTLWELHTYGEEPWAGHRAADVLRVTEAGERLPQPPKCPHEIYEIIQLCWNISPEARPKFNQLRKLLGDYKFTTAECRQFCAALHETNLELQAGDQVVIIAGSDASYWFGQCVGSRRFGTFPRTAVMVRSTLATQQSTNNVMSPPVSNESVKYRRRTREISRPIQGSFIHAGHGDIDPDKCFGLVNEIAKIYLENPIVRGPIDSSSRPKEVTFVPSIKHVLDNGSTMTPAALQRRASLSDVQSHARPLPPARPVIPESSASARPSVAVPSAAKNDPWGVEALWSVTPARSEQVVPHTPAPPPQRPRPTSATDFLTRPTTSARLPQALPHPVPNSTGRLSTAAATTSKSGPSLAEMQKQDSAFDWLKDELSGFAAAKISSTSINGSSAESHGSAAAFITTKPASSKYDSSISIPRPNRRNTTEIVRPVAGTTPTVAWSNFGGAAQKHPIVQLPMTSKPSTSSLPGTGAMNGAVHSVVAPSSPRIPPRSPPSVAPAPSNGVLPASTRTTQTTLPTSFQFPGASASSVQAPVRTTNAAASKVHEPDPFEISESVKTLAARMRYNELPQNGAMTSGLLAARAAAAPIILPTATATPVVASIQPPSIARPSQVLPQSQETLRPQMQNSTPSTMGGAQFSAASTIVTAARAAIVPSVNAIAARSTPASVPSAVAPSSTSIYPALAAPPAVAVTPAGTVRAPQSALNSSSSTGSNSTFGTWSSTSSADLASDLSHYFQPPRPAEPTPMPATTNWGHFGWQMPAGNPTPYAPHWSLNSHFVEQRAPTALVYNVQGSQLPAPSPTSKYSSIRYGLDGIPIIEPIPVMQATPAPYAPTNGTMNGRQPAATPVIDLSDLDPNKLIEKVRAKADFASVEQCRAALRRHDFDVDRTVRELKIEKLLETGLAADRDLATSALDSCQWSVNDAANRLIS